MKLLRILSIAGYLLISMILFESCATIFGSKMNTLTFESSRADSADVYIDSAYVGKAPGKIKVRSRVIHMGSELRVVFPDNTEFKQVMIRKPHTLYFIADAIVGGIPLGVDYATGQIHRPWPRKINLDVELQK